MTDTAKLPPLPPVEIKKHKPTEVMDYARSYGMACYEAGVEAAAKICDAKVVSLTSEREDRAALVAGICAAAIRKG